MFRGKREHFRYLHEYPRMIRLSIHVRPGPRVMSTCGNTNQNDLPRLSKYIAFLTSRYSPGM